MKNHRRSKKFFFIPIFVLGFVALVSAIVILLAVWLDTATRRGTVLAP